MCNFNIQQKESVYLEYGSNTQLDTFISGNKQMKVFNTFKTFKKYFMSWHMMMTVQFKSF